MVTVLPRLLSLLLAAILFASATSGAEAQDMTFADMLPKNAGNVHYWTDAAKSVDLFGGSGADGGGQGYLADRNPKDYVLLVPDDSAWSALGVTPGDVQQPTDKKALQQLLGCNIVTDPGFTGTIASFAKAQAGSADFSTAGGCKFTANWNAGRIALKSDGNVFAFISGPAATAAAAGTTNAFITDGFNQPGPADNPVASRMFSGPDMFPPKDFAAYAIVAFPSRPILKADTDRFLDFCRAYVATLSPASALPVPMAKQIVTVWPLGDDGLAHSLNSIAADKTCTDNAVNQYGLPVAQSAIGDAGAIGVHMDGRGPFLIAWSPASKKGASDAVALIVDLQQVQTYEQATREFLRWRQLVVENPALWQNGLTWDNVRDTAGLLADNWGTVLMRFLPGASP